MKQPLTRPLTRSLFTLTFSAFLFLGCADSIHAGYFTLTPSSQSPSPDAILDITVEIDTEDVKSNSADTMINYDPTYFRVLGVDHVISETPFYPHIVPIIEPLYVYIASYFGVNETVNAGKGVVATIHLQPLKTGTTKLDFQCVPGRTNESNITARQGDEVLDVIDCAKTLPLEITIKPSSGTPVPTGTSCTGTPSGDYNCDSVVNLTDFESWRQDFVEGKATLTQFEAFRKAFTSS
jgi:hypothetical protein